MGRPYEGDLSVCRGGFETRLYGSESANSRLLNLLGVRRVSV